MEMNIDTIDSLTAQNVTGLHLSTLWKYKKDYDYQMLHLFSGAIWVPVSHWKAFWNCGNKEGGPIVRTRPGEWGSVLIIFSNSGCRILPHHTCICGKDQYSQNKAVCRATPLLASRKSPNSKVITHRSIVELSFATKNRNHKRLKQLKRHYISREDIRSYRQHRAPTKQ